MGYSYDRSRVLTAGRNGFLILDGQNNGPNSSGKLIFRRPVTIAPEFQPHHLADAIKRSGIGGLETILKTVSREVPGLKTSITHSYAGQSVDGLHVGAHAEWKGDADKLVAALQAAAGPLGFTLTNWL